MSRNIGLALMLLTAVTVLLLAVISGNLFGYIVGGDFLITGLATWRWQAGTKYALGTGLIILAFSFLFLFGSEAMPMHGRYGLAASIAFLAGASITHLNDRNRVEFSPPLKKGD